MWRKVDRSFPIWLYRGFLDWLVSFMGVDKGRYFLLAYGRKHKGLYFNSIFEDLTFEVTRPNPTVTGNLGYAPGRIAG